MSGNFSARRRARFESLESRDLLAGDVVASLVEGVLVLEGDAEANQIRISSGAEGAIVVSGLDGTTVHREGGTPAAEIVVNGVTRGLRVGLGEGNDTLNLQDLRLRGTALVYMGAGDDAVNVGTQTPAVTAASLLDVDASVRIGGSLNMRTGDGNDKVVIRDAAIFGSLNFSTGLGDDTVALGGPDTAEASRLVDLSTDALAANLGVGGSIHADLGDGNDELSAANVRSRFLTTVFSGLGNDRVRLGRVVVLSLGVYTDGGDDAVSLANVHSARVGIVTGDGADQVSIVDSAFTALGVMLGGGNDVLSLDTVRARLAVLHGGEGEDELKKSGDNMFGTEIVRGFELPPDANTPVLPRIARLLPRLGAR